MKTPTQIRQKVRELEKRYGNEGELTLTELLELMAEWMQQESSAEWISVKDGLPPIFRQDMSKEVLTLAGDKMSVKYYDYELRKWTGSPYITITHWMPLPPTPTEAKTEEEFNKLDCIAIKDLPCEPLFQIPTPTSKEDGAEEWKVFNRITPLGDTGGNMVDEGITNGHLELLDHYQYSDSEELQSICDKLNATTKEAKRKEDGAEEMIWEEFSETMGSDVSDLEYWSGREVMNKIQFMKALKEYATTKEVRMPEEYEIGNEAIKRFNSYNGGLRIIFTEACKWYASEIRRLNNLK